MITKTSVWRGFGGYEGLGVFANHVRAWENKGWAVRQIVPVSSGFIVVFEKQDPKDRNSD